MPKTFLPLAVAPSLSYSPNLTVIEHPVLSHKITKLREKSSEPWLVRMLLRELGMLLGYEATRDLVLSQKMIDTPDKDEVPSPEITAKIGLLPVMRAGLGLLDGFTTLFPQAEIWHVGVKQDLSSGKHFEYYNGLNSRKPKLDVGIVMDPIVQTGQSARFGVRSLFDAGTPVVKLVCIVAAPEGIEALLNEFPSLLIYTALVEEPTDNWMYGWGDVGDRNSNTFK